MPATETELRLATWRDGSTQAERLAAAILRLEGYSEIEPQAPLGGADDRKDILCIFGSRRWLTAVYFPSTEKSFADITAKFEHDFVGVDQHHRDGFVFITNQRLTLSERDTLRSIARASNKECTIYDVERLRAVLDSPEGYGVRIAFLGITMTLAEQLAFFARAETAIEAALRRNTAQLQHLTRQIAGISAAQHYTMTTIQSLAERSGIDAADPPPPRIDPLALEDLRSQQGVSPLTAALDPAQILLIHRLVCIDLPARMIGRYRAEPVHIGPYGSPASDAVVQPPSHLEVPAKLAELCAQWCADYAIIAKWAVSEKLSKIADFHAQFLIIHPFLDGNGRVSRAILMQQCLDLFGQVDMSRFATGAAYFAALRDADEGDLNALSALIAQAVSAR